MSQFLDLIESINIGGPERDPGGGRRVRRYGDRNPRAFSEALRLTEQVLEGNRYAALQFTEAMSTSDFPLLFGDVLDRALLASYEAYPADLLSITRQRRLRDFRTAHRFAVDGAEGQLSKVGERQEYPERELQEARDEVAVEKYGAKISHSWEDMVNDDLDALRDAPDRHGKGARRTEVKTVSGLWVGSSGLSSTLFTGDNTLSGNPQLTTDNLEAALTHLASQTDEDGEPIFVGGAILVVGVGLESTARRILDTTEFRVTDADGNVQIVSGNAISRNLRLVVDPYVGSIADSNGDTTWAVFADPSDARPALEFDRLVGHENPEIWVRQPDAMRVGGGTVGPDAGSFDTDSIDYRVRHVIGGAALVNTGGRKAVVGSNGSGS